MKKELEFPLLQADYLEVRIASVKGPTDKSDGGVSLLIYKNARIDQNILDATVGRMNWQNRYYEIGGNLHCVISIWDIEKNIWVERDNVGVESNTEQTKGEASDAFKRAAFNWGIGRELYTAPFIWVSGKNCELFQFKDKWQCKTKFSVASIDYDDSRRICELTIVDQTGKTVFSFNKKGKAPVKSSSKVETKPLKDMPNALDVAFATKVTKGIDNGRTLKEVYELNNALRLFWIVENDPEAAEACMVVIESNEKLSKYYHERTKN